VLRLFVDEPMAAGTSRPLPPGAARHVKVRRLQPGEPLVLFDGRGGEWAARVAAISRSEVDVLVERYVDVDRELPLAVTLAVGMPANERMDTLVEKATELGVSVICPLHCERSVLHLEGERAARKRTHWQGIAVAAVEQCGRTRVPRIEAVASLAERLAATAGEPGLRWLLDPRAGQGLPARPPAGAVMVLSGPEGGFTPAEVQMAVGAGFVAVGLGPRVLRADTAPLALLAWLGLATV